LVTLFFTFIFETFLWKRIAMSIFELLQSTGSAIIRSGIAVHNDTDIPLLVVLSQLTPLHWSSEPVLPGETWNNENHLGIGKVWFHITVIPFREDLVPTQGGVAAGITAWSVGIVATSVLVTASGPIGGALFTLLARFNGGTNLIPPYQAHIAGARKSGVYADGKTFTVIRTTEGGRICLSFKEETASTNSSANTPSNNLQEHLSASSTSSSMIVSQT